jgi:hypothetical protein
MTVQNTGLRKAGPSQGNGVNTAFPFAFKVFSTADVLVVYLDASGVESTLVLSSDYSVTLNANQNTSPGGTVNMLWVPQTGTSITISSNLDNTQNLELTNAGGFYPSSINDALDRVVILIQQLAERSARAVRMPISDPASINMTLPTASARASKVLGFDADGNPIPVPAASAITDSGSITFSSAASYAAGTVGAFLKSLIAIGATLISYTPPGTGAITGTIANELDRGRIDVRRFGASPSASAATNNTAFAAAIAYCGITKQRLYVPGGTYALSQAFSTAEDLLIEADGDSTVLDFSGAVTGGTQCISVTGSLTSLPAITAANKDNLSLTFDSAPLVVPGDVFVIYDPTDYSWSGFRAYYRAGEWCEVVGVSGNVVTINNPLYASYTPANVSVYKMNSRNVSLRNFTIKGTTVSGLIKVSLCKNVRIENINSYNEKYQCIELDRCYGFELPHLTVFNKGAASDDYGLVVSNCQQGKVIGGNFYGRRHGIALGGGDNSGCVTTRDIKIIGSTIKNDITSGVPAADYHGNTEDCVYENCTIYNGASWGGKNNKLDNCRISAALNGIIIYASEIKGGTHALKDCYLYSAGSPSAVSRAYIDVGGNSSPVTANTVEDTTFIVENCVANLPGSTSSDMFAVMVNNGATVKTNFVIDGVIGVGITAMSNILRTRKDSGSVNSDFIVVDNISRFPNGTALHFSVSYDYSNVPQRMQRQTGKVSLTAASGTAYTIASPINYRYPYPREPVGFAVASTSTGQLYNGNRATYAGLHMLTDALIRPYIESGDATNWSATSTITVNWSAEINDI